MSKQHGLGAGLFVAGFDVSGDTQQVSNLAGPNSPLDVTGISQFAFERRKGQIDGVLNTTVFFNDADDQAHEVFSALPTADQIATYVHKLADIGTPAASLVYKQIGYDPNRAQDGSLAFTVNAQANGYGLDWGKMLTAGKRTDASATSPSTGVDMTGSDFGLQAYCHIFSLGSGTPTIKLQESSEVDGATDTFADVTGGGFTIQTAQTAERIQTARDQTIEQYLRVVTTGTFTNLVFAVAVKVNKRETTF